jgi:hypothetical protein
MPIGYRFLFTLELWIPVLIPWMLAHLTLEPSEFIIEHGFVNAHYRFVNAALESRVITPKMSMLWLELFMIILKSWGLRMEAWRYAPE